MRSLAIMAFLALQLSVFTCGFDIHVHAAGIDEGHVAEHIHDSDADHEEDSHDNGCHVHASHSFTMADEKQINSISVASMPQHFAMAETYLKSLPSLIEHPPKLQYCSFSNLVAKNSLLDCACFIQFRDQHSPIKLN